MRQIKQLSLIENESRRHEKHQSGVQPAKAQVHMVEAHTFQPEGHRSKESKALSTRRQRARIGEERSDPRSAKETDYHSRVKVS